MQIKYSPIAQPVEHATVNRRVVGSSPTWGAIKAHKRKFVSFFISKWQVTKILKIERNVKSAFVLVGECL